MSFYGIWGLYGCQGVSLFAFVLSNRVIILNLKETCGEMIEMVDAFFFNVLCVNERRWRADRSTNLFEFLSVYVKPDG